MNSKKLDFTVGLFVLVGLLAIIYMAIQIGGSRFIGGDVQRVAAIFTNVGGLNENSNVMIAGVKVGTVGSIKLNPDTLKAEVNLLLDKDIALYEDATASIKTNGLIGDKYVDIYPGTPIEGMELVSGDKIVDTEPALDIESLISRFAFGSVTKDENQPKTDATQ